MPPQHDQINLAAPVLLQPSIFEEPAGQSIKHEITTSDPSIGEADQKLAGEEEKHESWGHDAQPGTHAHTNSPQNLLTLPAEIRNRIFHYVFGHHTNTLAPAGLGPLLACRQFYYDHGNFAFLHAIHPLRNTRWDLNPADNHRRAQRIGRLLSASQHNAVTRVTVNGPGTALLALHTFHPHLNPVEYRVTMRLNRPGFHRKGCYNSSYDVMEMINSFAACTRNGRFRSLIFFYPDADEWGNFERFIAHQLTRAATFEPNYRFIVPQRPWDRLRELVEEYRVHVRMEPLADEAIVDRAQPFDVYFERPPRTQISTNDARRILNINKGSFTEIERLMLANGAYHIQDLTRAEQLWVEYGDFNEP
jgi:hypothetical protein